MKHLLIGPALYTFKGHTSLSRQELHSFVPLVEPELLSIKI